MIRIQVEWTGDGFILSEHMHYSRFYPSLDRLTAKLARRGFRIERTGAGERRLAFPVTEQAKVQSAALVAKNGASWTIEDA